MQFDPRKTEVLSQKGQYGKQMKLLLIFIRAEKTLQDRSLGEMKYIPKHKNQWMDELQER